MRYIVAVSQSYKNLIWFRNELISEKSFTVPFNSPSARYGLTPFEGVRGYYCEDTKSVSIFRLKEHVDRLNRSIKLLNFSQEFSFEEILSGIRHVCVGNDLWTDSYFRIEAFCTEGSWHSKSELSLVISGVENLSNLVKSDGFASLFISSWKRIGIHQMPPYVKVGANYLNSRYAFHESQANQCDFPILLNLDGKLTESSGANLFLVQNKVLKTPKKQSEILDGVTRDSIIQIASGIGIETLEVDLTIEDIQNADEIFLCGTSVEIMPGKVIDRGNGHKEKQIVITKQIKRRFNEVVRGAIHDFSHWLIPIFPKDAK